MSWIITGTQKNKGLLDEFSGAAAAYSLRNLSLLSNPAVVRVRRDNDNAEQDFTATEVSDGTLAAWVGAGNNGFVRTWYDQSGNNRNATQTTSAQQPKIVATGSIVTGGIDFDGTDDRLFLPQPLSGTSGRSLFCVVNADTTDTNEAILAATDVVNTVDGAIWNFTAETAIRVVGNVEWTNDAMTTKSLGSIHLPQNGLVQDHTFYRNSQLRTPAGTALGSTPINTQAATRSIIGASHNEVSFYDGTVAELIIYSSDQSTSRTAIEANINAHYSIYP